MSQWCHLLTSTLIVRQYVFGPKVQSKRLDCTLDGQIMRIINKLYWCDSLCFLYKGIYFSAKVHATLLYCHDLGYIVLMTACNFLSETGQNFYLKPISWEKLLHDESTRPRKYNHAQRVKMTFQYEIKLHKVF